MRVGPTATVESWHRMDVLYAVITTSQGGERILGCKTCGKPLIGPDPDDLYLHLLEVWGEVKPWWFIRKYGKLEDIDIQPEIRVGEEVKV